MLQLLYIGLALFDAWFSSKRIPQLGIEAEYNPLIRWISKKYGIKTGIYIGVLLPTSAIISVSCVFPGLLIFLLGCRTTLFAFQLKSFNDRKSRGVY